MAGYVDKSGHIDKQFQTAERDLMHIFYRGFLGADKDKAKSTPEDLMEKDILEETTAKKILRKMLALEKEQQRIVLHSDVIRILFTAIDIRYAENEELVLDFLSQFPEYVGPLFDVSHPAATKPLDVSAATPLDLPPERYKKLGEEVYLGYTPRLTAYYASLVAKPADATQIAREKRGFIDWVISQRVGGAEYGALKDMCTYLANIYKEKKVKRLLWGSWSTTTRREPEWFVSPENVSQLFEFMRVSKSQEGLYYYHATQKELKEVYEDYNAQLREASKLLPNSKEKEHEKQVATWKKNFTNWVKKCYQKNGALESICGCLAKIYNAREEIKVLSQNPSSTEMKAKPPEWFVSAENANQLFAFMSTVTLLDVSNATKAPSYTKPKSPSYTSLEGGHSASQAVITQFLGKKVVDAYKKDPTSFTSQTQTALHKSLLDLFSRISDKRKADQKEDQEALENAIETAKLPIFPKPASKGVFLGGERFQLRLFSKLPAIGGMKDKSEGKKLAALALQGSGFALGILNNVGLRSQLFAFLKSEHHESISSPRKSQVESDESISSPWRKPQLESEYLPKNFFNKLIDTAIKSDQAARQKGRFAQIVDALLSSVPKQDLEDYVSKLLLGRFGAKKASASLPLEVYLDQEFTNKTPDGTSYETPFCLHTARLFTRHFDFFATFASSPNVKKDYLAKLFRASSNPLELLEKCQARRKLDSQFDELFIYCSVEILVSLFEKYRAGEIESSVFDKLLPSIKGSVELLINQWSKTAADDATAKMLCNKIDVLFSHPALLQKLNLAPETLALLDNGEKAAETLSWLNHRDGIGALINVEKDLWANRALTPAQRDENTESKDRVALVIALSPSLWKQVDPFQKYWVKAIFYNWGETINEKLRTCGIPYVKEWRVKWPQDFFKNEIEKLKAFSSKLAAKAQEELEKFSPKLEAKALGEKEVIKPAYVKSFSSVPETHSTYAPVASPAAIQQTSFQTPQPILNNQFNADPTPLYDDASNKFEVLGSGDLRFEQAQTPLFTKRPKRGGEHSWSSPAWEMGRDAVGKPPTSPGADSMVYDEVPFSERMAAAISSSIMELETKAPGGDQEASNLAFVESFSSVSETHSTSKVRGVLFSEAPPPATPTPPLSKVASSASEDTGTDAPPSNGDSGSSSSTDEHYDHDLPYDPTYTVYMGPSTPIYG